MSYQPQFPGMFSPDRGPMPAQEDAPRMPATEKQVHYAMALAAKAGIVLPKGLVTDRAALSSWIDAHRPKAPDGQFANYPASRQVAFAERIARLKRSEVPPECFRDRTLMSRWIDSNKPR